MGWGCESELFEDFVIKFDIEIKSLLDFNLDREKTA